MDNLSGRTSCQDRSCGGGQAVTEVTEGTVRKVAEGTTVTEMTEGTITEMTEGTITEMTEGTVKHRETEERRTNGEDQRTRCSCPFPSSSLSL
jgi:hypothetical protein